MASSPAQTGTPAPQIKQEPHCTTAGTLQHETPPVSTTLSSSSSSIPSTGRVRHPLKKGRNWEIWDEIDWLLFDLTWWFL